MPIAQGKGITASDAINYLKDLFDRLGDDFQEDEGVDAYFYLEVLKYYVKECTCDADWTDGTGWCESCGKERK